MTYCMALRPAQSTLQLSDTPESYAGLPEGHQQWHPRAASFVKEHSGSFP